MAKYLCADTNIGTQLATSDDLITWTSVGAPADTVSSYFYAISGLSTGHALIGNGAGDMWVTENEGASWTEVYQRVSSPFHRICGSVIANSRFVGVNEGGEIILAPYGTGTAGATLISSVGLTGDLDVNYVQMVVDGTNVLAVGTAISGGEPHTRSSTNSGDTWGAWTDISGSLGSGFIPQITAVFNNLFIIVGVSVAGDGLIYSSADMSTWTLRYTHAANEFRRYIVADDRIMVWDWNAELFESFDGTSWVAVAGEDPYPGVGGSGNGIDAFSSGLWDATDGSMVPLGDQSTDYGRTWTELSNNAFASIVAFGVGAAPYTRWWTDYVLTRETET